MDEKGLYIINPHLTTFSKQREFGIRENFLWFSHLVRTLYAL